MNNNEITKRMFSYKIFDEIFDKRAREVSNISREKQIFMFKILHENVNQYTDDQLDTHFNEKNNDWDNWCNDVALFYAYRHLLFPTKPIPIAHPSFNKT